MTKRLYTVLNSLLTQDITLLIVKLYLLKLSSIKL